jgi:hypothetical protein
MISSLSSVLNMNTGILCKVRQMLAAPDPQGPAYPDPGLVGTVLHRLSKSALEGLALSAVGESCRGRGHAGNSRHRPDITIRCGARRSA